MAGVPAEIRIDDLNTNLERNCHTHMLGVGVCGFLQVNILEVTNGSETSVYVKQEEKCECRYNCSVIFTRPYIKQDPVAGYLKP